jgi:hypothetical protein
MQYVSIDIETLGLNPETCDTIEVGAVLDTIPDDGSKPLSLSDLPTFQCYITKPGDIYQGEPFAMWMNSKILKRIADREEGFSYIPGDMLDEVFTEWLAQHMAWEVDKPRKVVAAGKNFASFDLPFLKRLGFGAHFRLHHRSLDPGSMFYQLGDTVPPDLQECLKRARLGERVITHNAVDDAMDVVRCIRYHASTKTN